MSLSNCTDVPGNKALEENFRNPLEKSERLTFLAFYCAVSTVGALANAWSLAVIPARAYQMSYKFCLASLSISDFIYGILVSVDNGLRLETDTPSWVLTDSACSFIPFITTACVLNSSLTISCIALDRCLALNAVREKYKPGLLGSTILIAFFWCFSFGVSVSVYLEYTATPFCILRVTPTTLVCSSCAVLCLNNRNVVWYSIVYGLIFLPIIAIFIVSYLQIISYTLQTKSRSLPLSQSSTELTEMGPQAERKANQSPKMVSARRKLRTFKIVLAIIILFIIGRLPQFTLNLITNIGVPLGSHEMFICRYVFSILGVANSAFNPFLYSLLDDVLNLKRRLGYKTADCMQIIRECFQRRANVRIYQVND